MRVLPIISKTIVVCLSIFCFSVPAVWGQNPNCFLVDFVPRNAKIPISEQAIKTTDLPTVTVTLTGDTLGKISKYIFGNAIAVWMGNVTDNTVFVKNVQALSPTLIRFPGGSWSNNFFWNGKPTDIPDSIYDGTTGKKTKFYPISGKNDWSTTVDNYYKLRSQVNTQGLITVNYSYARYGLSQKPVQQAAHLAADWVRYDKGRTKYWEVGNENGGPWESGWMIDVATNKDGQPKIITGQLYGQHFRVIADSMRHAATKIGAKIFIGAQILHFDGTNSWNSVDKTWNAGVFKEVGDAADFYVMHNYYGTAATVDNLLSVGATEPKINMDFINKEIAAKKAYPKPVAVTEYNMNTINNNSTPQISYINGLQEVILFNELIKNNYGLSARWLLATGETGMFYQGSTAAWLWQARPEFYYAYYTQKFTGDHVISATSNNSSVLAYASRFAGGETGIMVVNRGKTAQVVKINSTKIGVGDNYYLYSLTGGTDNGDFSLKVSVNGVGPTGTQWGPRETLETIPAKAYSTNGNMILNCPGRSVQFILAESGTNLLFPTATSGIPEPVNKVLCYPNPFVSSATLEFSTAASGTVKAELLNPSGEKIATLLNEILPEGNHFLPIDGSRLSPGIYLIRLQTGDYSVIRKILLAK